jgi:hypothetical protein
MATPTGDYTINANGFHGTLHLQDDGGGNVSGNITFDGTSFDPVKGVWNDSSQQLIFQRSSNGNTHVQNYAGYYFENTGQFFATPGAPSGPPNFRVLAGSFDDVLFGNQRPRFGWVARQAI